MLRLQSLAVAVLVSLTALAQNNAGAQANVSASQSSSVSADHSGAQAQSNTSANADAAAQMSHPRRQPAQEPQHDRKPHNSAASASGSGQLVSGSTINAELVKPVDARKAKPGDAVVARTTQDVKSDGHVVIPKGSRLVGHVTQAQTRAKGDSQSSLGIAFDQAVLRNGEQVPMSATIQALAAAQSSAALASDDGMSSMPAMAPVSAGGGGGLLGGAGAGVGTVTSTAGGVGGNVGGALGSATSATGSLGGALNSTSSGVVGMPGMALQSATSAAAQGSVITSAGKNIHLDSGTQMVLRVAGSASQQ